ncbi:MULTISPECIES: LysR family transcriptional regulator [Streptomyces]|uniref:DNA-binding transcriptional LysR family regulator n=4 Tax=Streptomyces TaxID=1883 RepID=A0A7W3NU10_STRMR|nr:MULTISPECIES: LysR family transcriptional regulator [Streptomyces]MBA9056771.1 DNA-binding transcriptional LysR family regulator [Streptomyces murinus]UWW91192.1 LysR family transcriptional regulator [Streptomyces murinus]WSI88429.1 LysR family transcriptional regulator [Streptomyces murinus]WUD10058.1 LysR family transcriptional regulator [Streptomyces murinus]
MSLRQMEYFVTVVQEASFTRAADALHVTQSALSHQIKALEKEVGGALLERLPRGARLTPMGRAFLPGAELAVRSAARARRAARAAAGAEGGELHVAALHSIAVGALPDVFARWRADRPRVLLRLHEYATAEALEDAVRRGTADLAIGPEPAEPVGTVVPIGAEEIVLVVPFDDRLAGRSTVTLPELADRAWVRCAMEPVVHGARFLDWACGRAGFTPRTAVWTEQSSTAVRMAAAGVGVCAAPAHIVRGAVGEDCVLLTPDPSWRRPLAVYARTEPTGAAAAFVDLLRTRWPAVSGLPERPDRLPLTPV